MGDETQVQPQTQPSAIRADQLYADEKISPLSSANGTKDDKPNLPNPPRGIFSRAISLLTIFWLLTESDLGTFVGPNTAFGVCGALSGALFVTTNDTAEGTSALKLLERFSLVVLFNWSNLLIFNLANQRLPESAHEDALNKPWRAVPSGLLTWSLWCLWTAMLYMLPPMCYRFS